MGPSVSGLCGWGTSGAGGTSLARGTLRVIRKVRRRRLRRPRRLLAALLGVAVAAGLYVILTGPFLRLQTVAVTGGPQALWRAGGLRLGMPLWSIDLPAADAELLRRVPALASAAFRRNWPNRLTLRVTYRRPVAAVAGPQETLYGVDATGRVLTPLSAKSGFAVLGGVSPSMIAPYRDLSGKAVQAVTLAADLAAQGFRVAEVTATTPMQVYLPSGTEVLWPRTSKNIQTLTELKAVLAALQNRGAVAASIDLRVLSRPLVVLRK